MTHDPSEPPPIACTLSADQLTTRSSEWVDLLARVTERQARPDGIRLRLPAAPDVAATAADLIVREVECCAFFTFTLNVDASGLWLDVATPPDGRALVDELFGSC